MVVSLEAIFLATFVLISQNRLSAEAEHRADLDLHIGLLIEHELTRVLQMLDVMQDKMGIENDADSELATWKWKPGPKMCWRRSHACNSVRVAATSVMHVSTELQSSVGR